MHILSEALPTSCLLQRPHVQDELVRTRAVGTCRQQTQQACTLTAGVTCHSPMTNRRKECPACTCWQSCDQRSTSQPVTGAADAVRVAAEHTQHNQTCKTSPSQIAGRKEHWKLQLLPHSCTNAICCCTCLLKRRLRLHALHLQDHVIFIATTSRHRLCNWVIRSQHVPVYSTG
jgi:hypothetical protein